MPPFTSWKLRFIYTELLETESVSFPEQLFISQLMFSFITFFTLRFLSFLFVFIFFHLFHYENSVDLFQWQIRPWRFCSVSRICVCVCVWSPNTADGSRCCVSHSWHSCLVSKVSVSLLLTGSSLFPSFFVPAAFVIWVESFSCLAFRNSLRCLFLVRMRDFTRRQVCVCVCLHSFCHTHTEV